MYHSEFHPNWASAPGDTIADILQERNLPEHEFARLINFTTENVRDLLQGRITITLAMARQLAQVLGGSVEFWMARDFQYRQDIARSRVTDEQWVNEFPLDDMVKYGWVPQLTNVADKVVALLRFFDLPSIRLWNETYAGVMQRIAFKKSQAYESRAASVAAWLRQGEIQAEEIPCKPWNAKSLEADLSKMRSLTREKDPQKFIPKLRSYCAESGIALVAVRTPRGCPASGATKFISKDKALILLSFRHLTDDHFWFAFFHEVGHLLFHSDKALFLEGTDIPSTAEEEEANEFAQNILIPSQHKEELLRLRASSREIIRFALKVGIAPGIVVGQLQHLGLVPHHYFQSLKRHYTWES